MVATALSASRAAAQSASAACASRSAQKTYSQAAARLGRDSRFERLIDRAAKTWSAARREPGSLRTQKAIVVLNDLERSTSGAWSARRTTRKRVLVSATS